MNFPKLKKSTQKKPSKSKAKQKFSYDQFKATCKKIGITVYHLRKVVLAVPVAYAALRLAAYNMANLPEQVGINLQATGEFAMQISRYSAVVGPLVLTAWCLVMMFLSRKAMYAWSISIFSLILPLLLLVSNRYPA